MRLETGVVVLLTSVVSAIVDFSYHGNVSILEFTEDREFSVYYFRGDYDEIRSVDLIEEPTDLVYFPKCCPPGSSYYRLHHSCVDDNTTYIDNPDPDPTFALNLIKTVLEECEVIIDYHFPTYTLKFDESLGLILEDRTLHFGQYCFDFDYMASGYVVRSCESVDYCLSNAAHDVCLRKCCADGYMYINKKCQRDPTFGFNVSEFEQTIVNYSGAVAVYNVPLRCTKFQPSKDDSDYTILPNGGFIWDNNGFIQEYTIHQPVYCFEGTKGPNNTDAVPILLVCFNVFDTSNNDVKFVLSKVALVISSTCLLLTLIIFFLTSRIRTLMGKIVTVYSANMLSAFIVLTLVQFIPNLQTFCKPIGYMILFSFTAVFAWLNVMCYEIWKTFGALKDGVPNETQKQLFIRYNLYSWTAPALITISVLIFNTFHILPDKLHPFIGERQCILENRITEDLYGHTFFVVFPQAIMIIINTVLFVDTLRRYFIVTNEMSNLQNIDHETTTETSHARRKKDKVRKYHIARFFMVVKLSLIMGLSWFFEVVSSLVNFEQHPTMSVIQIVFDTFNCLQGVLVFAVFVLNRKTILQIARRLGLRKQKQDIDSVSSDVSTGDKQEMTEREA